MSEEQYKIGDKVWIVKCREDEWGDTQIEWDINVIECEVRKLYPTNKPDRTTPLMYDLNGNHAYGPTKYTFRSRHESYKKASEILKDARTRYTEELENTIEAQRRIEREMKEQ